MNFDQLCETVKATDGEREELLAYLIMHRALELWRAAAKSEPK